MSESDNPQGIGADEPLSMTEAISALTKAETPKEPDEGQPEDEEAEEQGETSPEGEDDQNADEEEDATEEGQPEDDEDDGQPRDDQGRFITRDDAKVRLDDGTVVTLAELKAGNLKDRDYRQKTEAVAQERKALETVKSEAAQRAQALQQQLDYVQTFIQHVEPKAPDRALMDTDPVGYMQAKAAYDDQVKHFDYLKSLRQHETQEQQREQARVAQERQKEEARQLLEKMPELRDPKRYVEFYGNAVKTMSDAYGFSPEEIEGYQDHRIYTVFRDLMAYHKIKAASKKVPSQVEGRPPVLRSGQRPPKGAHKAQARKAASDRLAKTGSVKDAVAALLLSEEGT